MLGNVGELHLVHVNSGEVPLKQIIMHGQAGVRTVFTALPPENGPPLAIPADPPHSPCDHDLTRGCGIIGKKLMTKLGIYHKRGEEGVSPGDFAQLTCDDLLLPAKVIGLPGELQDPQRHRDRDTVSGELTRKCVEPFPASSPGRSIRQRGTGPRSPVSTGEFGIGPRIAQLLLAGTTWRLPLSVSALRVHLCAVIL